MLLEPFEEQFHLTAAFEQRGDGQGRQTIAAGQEDQVLLGLGIFVPDTAQVLGVVL